MATLSAALRSRRVSAIAGTNRTVWIAVESGIYQLYSFAVDGFGIVVDPNWLLRANDAIKTKGEEIRRPRLLKGLMQECNNPRDRADEPLDFRGKRLFKLDLGIW
ncbi:hypothetical protein DTW90_21850 [Neorhizobium sp. P12A]|nr:hypothetical protein DTW90_21850 [Neorhizobium sp. P12A]